MIQPNWTFNKLDCHSIPAPHVSSTPTLPGRTEQDQLAALLQSSMGARSCEKKRERERESAVGESHGDISHALEGEATNP